MMSNIVGIRGEPVMAPGEVVPEVVKIAEDILEMAKSGNISGLMAFATHSDEAVSVLHHGVITLRVIGAVTNELHQMCRKIE